MKPRSHRPDVGEPILLAGGGKTVVASFALYQPEAPKIYTLDTATGAEIRATWNGAAWVEEGAVVKTKTELPSHGDLAVTDAQLDATLEEGRRAGTRQVASQKLLKRKERAMPAPDQNQATAPADVTNRDCPPPAPKRRGRPPKNLSSGAKQGAQASGAGERMDAPAASLPLAAQFTSPKRRGRPRSETTATSQDIVTRLNCAGYQVTLSQDGRSAQVAARRCRACGCTDDDCSACIERTGRACHWIESDLCSACRGFPGVTLSSSQAGRRNNLTASS